MAFYSRRFDNDKASLADTRANLAARLTRSCCNALFSSFLTAMCIAIRLSTYSAIFHHVGSLSISASMWRGLSNGSISLYGTPILRAKPRGVTSSAVHMRCKNVSSFNVFMRALVCVVCVPCTITWDAKIATVTLSGSTARHGYSPKTSRKVSCGSSTLTAVGLISPASSNISRSISLPRNSRGTPTVSITRSSIWR